MSARRTLVAAVALAVLMLGAFGLGYFGARESESDARRAAEGRGHREGLEVGKRDGRAAGERDGSRPTAGSGEAIESGTIGVGASKAQVEETWGPGRQPGHGAGCLHDAPSGEVLVIYDEPGADSLACPDLSPRAVVREIAAN